MVRYHIHSLWVMSSNPENGEVSLPFIVIYELESGKWWDILHPFIMSYTLESEKILRYLCLLSRMYAAGINGDWRRLNIEKGNECKGELAGSPSNWHEWSGASYSCSRWYQDPSSNLCKDNDLARYTRPGMCQIQSCTTQARNKLLHKWAHQHELQSGSFNSPRICGYVVITKQSYEVHCKDSWDNKSGNYCQNFSSEFLLNQKRTKREPRENDPPTYDLVVEICICSNSGFAAKANSQCLISTKGLVSGWYPSSAFSLVAINTFPLQIPSCTLQNVSICLSPYWIAALIAAVNSTLASLNLHHITKPKTPRCVQVKPLVFVFSIFLDASEAMIVFHIVGNCGIT